MLSHCTKMSDNRRVTSFVVIYGTTDFLVLRMADLHRIGVKQYATMLLTSHGHAAPTGCLHFITFVRVASWAISSSIRLSLRLASFGEIPFKCIMYSPIHVATDCFCHSLPRGSSQGRMPSRYNRHRFVDYLEVVASPHQIAIFPRRFATKQCIHVCPSDEIHRRGKGHQELQARRVSKGSSKACFDHVSVTGSPQTRWCLKVMVLNM